MPDFENLITDIAANGTMQTYTATDDCVACAHILAPGGNMTGVLAIENADNTKNITVAWVTSGQYGAGWCYVPKGWHVNYRSDIQGNAHLKMFGIKQ